MEKRNRLSGAAYRKKAQEKIENEKSLLGKIPKISSFFPSGSTSIQLPAPGPTSSEQKISNKNDDIQSGQSGTTQTDDDRRTIEQISPPSTTLLSVEYTVSKDPADWIINDKTIEAVIRNPPKQNTNADFLDSAVKENSTGINRYLTKKHFYKKLLNGETQFRDWLLYSASRGCVFCIPCRLFSQQEENSFTTTGFNDWKNASARLQQHEESQNHRSSVLCLLTRSKVINRIDTSLTNAYRNEVQYWRDILKRVVATIVTLTTRGLALRGENSKIGSVHNGNFLGCLELIAEFDPFLREHLAKFGNAGHGNCNYLSNTICEELVVLMAKRVSKTIIDETKRSKYYSIIIDSTPDVSHIDQLAFLVRYISPEGIPSERFLKYIPSAGHKSMNLEMAVISTLEEHNLDITDCRGQSYDNASNMSGAYSGLQARIKSHNKLVEYVPCSAHSLNLSGSLAAESCQNATLFFHFLQNLYTFFSASTYRWDILSKNIKTPVVKSLSETRWSARADATKALYSGYNEIKISLSQLSDDESQTGAVRHEARALFEKMDEFETSLLVVIWHHILERMNATNKYVQNPAICLGSVVRELEGLIEYLNSIRNDFAIYEQEGKHILQNQTKTYKEGRRKRRKVQFDDGDSEEAAFSPRDQMKIGTFYVIIDVLTTDLKRRLDAYQRIYQRFYVLTNFWNLENEIIVKEGEKLIKIYENDLDASFIQECIHLKAHLQNDMKSPLEICKYLRDNCLKETFPNLDIALRIYLSIPVANSSSERSFSKLSRIKNNFRSTMKQERLNALSILSLESDITKNVCYDDVINDFAEEKSRKKPF